MIPMTVVDLEILLLFQWANLDDYTYFTLKGWHVLRTLVLLMWKPDS